jgi:hypothetical protein
MIALTAVLLALLSAPSSARDMAPLPEDAIFTPKPADATVVKRIREDLARWEARVKLGGPGLLLLAETGGPTVSAPGAIVRVPAPLTWPADTRTSFTIVVDEAGRIRMLRESPVSYSGDWSLDLTHYFDEAGRTLAFRRSFGFFGSGCADIARETSTIFLGSGARILARDFRFEDGDQKPLSPGRCELRPRPEYRIHLDVDAALASLRLVEAVRGSGSKSGR